MLIAEGTGSTRKIEKGQAALKVLRELEKRGLLSKNQYQDNRDGEIGNKIIKESDTSRSKITPFEPQPAEHTPIANDSEESASKTEIPVIKTISTKKGGPRSSLYELCRKMQWPMPTMTSSEQKSKILMEVGDGVDKRTTYNSFESRISMTIPSCGVIELVGEPRADKKSSFDSAALLILHRRGKIKIE